MPSRACRREEEAPLADDLVAHLDLDREQEREHQLVHLEDRAADVGVEEVRDELAQVDDAHLDVLEAGALGCRRRRAAEPVQRVLVHRVDVGEVGDAEEEDRAAVGDGHVLGARGVDLLLGDLRLGDCRHDLLGGRLRDRERLDELRVVEDVALELESMYRSRPAAPAARLFSAFWMMICALRSARSGRSVSTVETSSWSSRPSCVMAKLSIATFTDTSGA